MRRLARHYARLAIAAQLLALGCMLLLPAAAIALSNTTNYSLADTIVLAVGRAAIFVFGFLVFVVVWAALPSTDSAKWESTNTFDRLKALDPDFSEDVFFERLKEMFAATQKAWQARDMEPTRRFLSDKQFRESSAHAAEYVKHGLVNRLDELNVIDASLVAIAPKDGFYLLKVMINATAIDRTIEERTGIPVSWDVAGDEPEAKPFTEFWTLERRTAVQAPTDASVPRCPHCGAPATEGHHVTCGYCGTLMNDPSHDWVVLRIQPPRKLPRRRAAAPNAATTSTTRSA